MDLGTRIVFWCHVSLAIASVVWTAGWHRAYSISRFGGDGSVFLLLGFAVYFISFPVLLTVLTPALSLDALRRGRQRTSFWVSFATLVAFNVWASMQLYLLQRDGV